MSTSKDGLPKASASLLSKVAQLRELERRRREAPVSSTEFHDLGEMIAAKSREIERSDPSGSDRQRRAPGSESTEEVEARPAT